MTKISKSEVVHLARLSNLTLSSQEIEDLRYDLEKIVGYITELSSLNTDGVTPTYQVGGQTNVWREDVVDATPIAREKLLATAPSVKDNQIKVPKVL